MVWGFEIKQVRWSAIILGISNLFLMITSLFLIDSAYQDCPFADILPFLLVSIFSCLRLLSMVPIAIAQRATAMAVLNALSETSSAAGTLVRRQQRELEAKVDLYFRVGYVELLSTNTTWMHDMVVVFIIMVCYVTLLQCCSGSDVLRWRSFYTNEHRAWKHHYREVFDQGIREALCCLGRVKYLGVMEEDEVSSVAQLLGDLVSYRAAGTGHLELLAGLALLKKESLMPKHQEETKKAPEELIQGAADFHPFAEAAYTGLLLDVGRNPVLFPCAWLYRQGILTPWIWNRLPKLEGDNWWRGHASAFLRYVQLPAEVLRQGRVCQARCEAAYFVVVLHHIKSVVICVRGTETPEDLLTDGLSRECMFATEDIGGLI
ncbi:hypothetical protein OSB04_008573 [Centaurea solstitialis]|uniref:DUF7358 domain-containing protein n=1 Tax=Centaurea solstitialis TaxID=347529 RepID=A0AA38TM41_9ASTR|nr:hypothetical protein OSB04_008573 [Centaurea solstitialis]